MRIDRRGALGLIGLAAAGKASAQSLKAAFKHGVASGDPLQDRVVLWTRITPEGAPGRVPYRWRLWAADGSGLERSGEGETAPGRDYTVKVDVAGLKPGREYRFQFEAGGSTSPEGRTKTLPAGRARDVVLAIASCSLYPNGYFNAYQAIADLPRLDAVLHLGDYYYEYGAAPGDYGMDSPVAAQRPHDPPGEIVTLSDYRRRHAQYKADPQLQAAHARAAWIVTWDDHETCNDSYRDGAQNHQPAVEGTWSARKAAAIQAYYEWMPIREPEPGRAFDAINRSFHFGDLASLIMLETRLVARSKQLSYDTDAPDVATFKARLADPSRTMMGERQREWLARELTESVRAGRPWQVLGNQVLLGRLVPTVSEAMLTDEALAKLTEPMRRRIRRLAQLPAQGLPVGLDIWDGYPAAREELYETIRASGAHAVVVSGDSHAFWANELKDDAGRRVGAEFGTTSITSPGGEDSLPGFPLAEAFMRTKGEVVYNDQKAKGFVLLTLTRQAARAEMRAVSTIADRNFTTSTLKRFEVRPAGPGSVSALREA